MPWTHAQKSAAWNKATVVANNEPNVWRKDDAVHGLTGQPMETESHRMAGRLTTSLQKIMAGLMLTAISAPFSGRITFQKALVASSGPLRHTEWITALHYDGPTGRTVSLENGSSGVQ